jgi:hypothetical protein
MRHWHKDMPNNDAEADFAWDRVVGYCNPEAQTDAQRRGEGSVENRDGAWRTAHENRLGQRAMYRRYKA